MSETLCSYEWSKNGKPLGSVPNILFVGNGTLHISHLTRDNEGIYQCFAYNIYGRTMSTFAILRMAVRDSFSPVTNETAVAEGRPVMIGCRQTTKCFPVPHYSWVLKSDRSTNSPTIDLDSRRQIDEHGNCC